MKKSNSKISDLQTQVTDKIIDALEAGVNPWQCPWVSRGVSGIPINFSTETPYQGINILLLWMSAFEAGFTSNMWLTFNQAKKLGGKVRKGEKSVTCVYYGTGKKNSVDSDGEEKESFYRFPKPFSVFNIDQIDGLDIHLPDIKRGGFDESLDNQMLDKTDSLLNPYLSSNKIDVKYGGDKAFYRPANDFIQLPEKSQFKDADSFISTLIHECLHSTGHKARLNRFEENRELFKSHKEAYAYEELIATLGESLVCADFGIDSQLGSHASYIGAWLKALKNDKTLVFKAAAKAARGIDYIKSYSVEVSDQEAA